MKKYRLVPKGKAQGTPTGRKVRIIIKDKGNQHKPTGPRKKGQKYVLKDRYARG